MTRESVTVHLPEGFDSAKHSDAILQQVEEKYGAGFEIDTIDLSTMTARVLREIKATATTVNNKTKDVKLPRGTKPSDGEKIAAQQAELHPGFVLSTFEPNLGRATLTRMDAGTQRARDAVAVALAVKPWDITISPRPDGGYDMGLPWTYVPSKHDDKLSEVATAIVGKPGWYVEVDTQTLKASLVPGDPPNFPTTVVFPFTATKCHFDLDSGAWSHIPLGITLGRAGGDIGDELVADVAVTPHFSIQGTTGSGKGQTLMALMSGALANGWELAICDAIKGGVDFVKWKPFVRDGGWGDDLMTACAVISLVYKEGLRRKALVKKYEKEKWTQVPKSENIRPLLLVVDELTSLVAAEPIPKGVAKDNPLVIEIAERNLLKATITNTLGKIARELRFVGISLVAATQVASTITGISTEFRGNLGAKILLGAKPTDNNRRVSLNDPDAVPKVPLNIVNDPNKASQGVGVYEFEGQEPGVAKIYFAKPSEYTDWLEKIGVPTTRQPRPSAAQIAANTPSLDDDDLAPAVGKRVVEQVLDPVTGEALHGYEKANEQRRRLDGTSAAPVVGSDDWG